MAALRLCLLLFCLSLASVSSSKKEISKLKNINDLINTGYANRFPRHGLPLLYWLALNVFFDQNNIMRLNFSPRDSAFGFHLFENRDRPPLLPSLGPTQRYYSVGNLNPNAYHRAMELPLYVRERYARNVPESNMDRLIVSSDQNQPNRISRVFATAHYDYSETYEVDPELISTIIHLCSALPTEEARIREFLELLRYSCRLPFYLSSWKRSLDSQCEAIKLQIKTSTEGRAKLVWMNIPKNLFFVNIEICQNIYSSNTNDNPRQIVKSSVQIRESNGSFETRILLNAGLQPRLQLASSRGEVYWYGPEVDGGPPVRIKGCDASLQLCAANGKACARLYIKKTFSNWKRVLSDSWVGFYRYSQNIKHDTHQYVVKFAKIDKTEDYDIYQYNSSLTIAPGVQIRFLLDKNYDKVLAQTTPWERGEEETSVWSFPEFFYEPGFYDANSVVPSKIDIHDAGLQLFTKDGKACARLYINKTFKNWKETFRSSWVGFYTSSQKENNKYDAYQYATKFEKEVGYNENFEIYQYKSDLTIAPEVLLRFLMDEGYDKLLVETEPWKSA